MQGLKSCVLRQGSQYAQGLEECKHLAPADMASALLRSPVSVPTKSISFSTGDSELQTLLSGLHIVSASRCVNSCMLCHVKGLKMRAEGGGGGGGLWGSCYCMHMHMLTEGPLSSLSITCPS